MAPLAEVVCLHLARVSERLKECIGVREQTQHFGGPASAQLRRLGIVQGSRSYYCRWAERGSQCKQGPVVALTHCPINYRNEPMVEEIVDCGLLRSVNELAGRQVSHSNDYESRLPTGQD